MNFIQNSNIGFLEAFRRNLYFIPTQFNGTLETASYGVSLKQKYDNLIYLSHNIKPLYLKNNKEISTQREVDEETRNEIKMLLKEDGFDD